MTAEVPLVSVNLATVCIESFLYGAFCILFVSSLYLLTNHQRVTSTSKKRLKINPLITSSVCIFITITAHWICTFLRLFQAFVYFDNGSSALAFYANLNQTSEVVKTGFLMASLVMGDAMIIYRLWIIWNYNRAIVIFPIGTLIGLTVCGIGITYQFTQYKPGEDVFLSAAGRWITSDCVFTLCTNVYSSVLIAWRIWSVNMKSRKYGGTSLTAVLGIVVESAAIYTSWTIFFFASYQSRSNLQFIAVDAWPAMSGIAFTLINVRVGLGWAQKAQSSTSNDRSVGQITSRLGDIRSGVTGESYGMRPVAVKITQTVDKDSDYHSEQDTRNGDYVSKSGMV
ncbi:hypothetical protein BDQ17DRAFT_1255653 [Cyathus striatus]|nr:hypothetical protein BDQ17DRAFT_1255653 [Cyathus striatus]